jgi:diamine N-acetyltransferase
MITLQEITRENIWDIMDLKVAQDQEAFVSTNAESIAQSKVQPECIPLAIYEDSTPVGFAMYCMDEEDREYWIYRMMIDQKHQGKGYSKAALRLLLDRIQSDPEHHIVYLDVHPENTPAVRLYQGFGFRFTGKVVGKSHYMALEY